MTYQDLFSFYRSKEWETLRTRICLERTNENGDLICEHCGNAIVHPYDAICHHKTELTEQNLYDINVALNPDNILICHHKCHNQIHERFGYNSGVKKVYVVWGAPCAGKSTFVESAAGKHDLIVDINRIYECINTSRSKLLYDNVMHVYRQLIDMIRTRNGRWYNAWVMRTLPLSIDRERIINELGGAELIHIDTPKDVCMSRALTDFQKKLIEDYFSKSSINSPPPSI